MTTAERGTDPRTPPRRVGSGRRRRTPRRSSPPPPDSAAFVRRRTTTCTPPPARLGCRTWSSSPLLVSADCCCGSWAGGRRPAPACRTHGFRRPWPGRPVPRRRHSRLSVLGGRRLLGQRSYAVTRASRDERRTDSRDTIVELRGDLARDIGPSAAAAVSAVSEAFRLFDLRSGGGRWPIGHRDGPPPVVRSATGTERARALGSLT